MWGRSPWVMCQQTGKGEQPLGHRGCVGFKPGLDQGLQVGIAGVEANGTILPELPVRDDALSNVTGKDLGGHAALSAKGATAKPRWSGRDRRRLQSGLSV